MAERSIIQYQPVTGPVWREPVAEKLAWLPSVQQPARGLPPNRLGDFVRPEFEALYKAEGLQWSPSDRYFGRAIPREHPRWYVLDPIPPASPQHLTWVPADRYSGRPLPRSQRDFTIWPPFVPLYDPENLQWIPSDRYAGRELARSAYDSSVLVQLVTAAAFDPQTLDWQPRDRYFGRAPARSLVDWSVLQGEPIVAPIPVEPEADTHDGVGGGARIIYKRQHKRLHDEIEEYFAHIRLVPTEQEIAEVADVVAEHVPDLEARRAVSAAIRTHVLAVLLQREQTEELIALMARAQDEDDAIAVLVMMETLH